MSLTKIQIYHIFQIRILKIMMENCYNKTYKLQRLCRYIIKSHAVVHFSKKQKNEMCVNKYEGVINEQKYS